MMMILGLFFICVGMVIKPVWLGAFLVVFGIIIGSFGEP